MLFEVVFFFYNEGCCARGHAFARGYFSAGGGLWDVDVAGVRDGWVEKD